MKRSFSVVYQFRQERNAYPLTYEDMPEYILNSKKLNIKPWMENLL